MTLRAAVTAFAEAEGHSGLAQWIATHVQFPDTMVDRIVPTPHEGDIADARRLLGGIDDEIPVSAEPWFQWIIQHFEGPRPFWEAHHGTRFVHDVDMFERAKLQMLNGSHMLLAYVGQLLGRETIAEAASDPLLGPLARHFMRHEQTAGLDLPEAELDDYTDELVSRLKNPAIEHEAERISRNGSAKMAARVIRPMRENISAGRDVTGAVLLIANWIRWFALHEKEALEISLEDPRGHAEEDLRRMPGSSCGAGRSFSGDGRGVRPQPPRSRQVCCRYCRDAQARIRAEHARCFAGHA